MHLGQKCYLNVLLGCEAVDGVAESGFHDQEHDGSGPFRWTNGAAKLLVPIDRPPQRLWVHLGVLRPEATPVRVQLLVNGQPVFEGPVPPGEGEKTFDLGSQRFTEEALIELRSESFVPKGVMDGGKSTDERVLGVQVRGIMLQTDEE